MTVIVKNGVFSNASHSQFGPYVEFDAERGAPANAQNLDVQPDTDPSNLLKHLEHVESIRIAFPSSADGRGNSIARALRDHGYKGHLRAVGHVLADQYPLAIRSGFDDIEIDEKLAARQPEDQWRDALGRVSTTYQSRVMRPLSQDAAA